LQEQVCIQEDEIDLRELFKTLAKNKKFIIIFTTITTLLALVYVMVKTPIYEVKSNVQIGFIGKELIADPSTLVKTLNIVFNVEDKVSTKDKFISEVSKISTNKKLKNFIDIRTQAISNEEALKKNKEVVKYIQNKYQDKIDQYILNNNNNIKDIKIQISNLENLEKKDIKSEINRIKTQKLVNIDKQIEFNKQKVKSIDEKIKFHTDKLKQYTKEINKLYKNNVKNTNSSIATIASIQMVNYQNLILNSQNKIEDLKLSKELILTQTIPNLNIKQENIKNDTLRKLQYKLDNIIPTKKDKLLQKIETLKYNNSEQNIQNSKVVGDFIVKNSPIKPKKILIVIVAFITGLILSIFLVFIIEFFRDEDKNEK
jgi:LPS O-antigen subunit length determinant protein (WzzB/FepE family)